MPVLSISAVATPSGNRSSFDSTTIGRRKKPVRTTPSTDPDRTASVTVT